MIFEVDSIEVALGIEYVVRHQKFHSANLVVLLPKDDDIFPDICHGGGWKDVRVFIWSGLSEEIVDRYRKLKAIIITIESGQILIIDIVGLKILELNCSYADALSYLRYLLYWMGGVYNRHYPFFYQNRMGFNNQKHNLEINHPRKL